MASLVCKILKLQQKWQLACFGNIFKLDLALNSYLNKVYILQILYIYCGGTVGATMTLGVSHFCSGMKLLEGVQFVWCDEPKPIQR
jgi:hypothetical protein